MSVNIFNKSTGSITQIAGNATGGGGTTVTVDNILSTTSENPVQNKVITGELNKKIDSSIKGVANGVAELDSNGKVLTAQLPSYVDDVLEYSGISDFPTEGETGKIYVDTTTNKTYRWSGSTYIEISESIALGETSSTAYRGDRGKIAYDHSQSAHAPADAEANVQSDWNETDTTSDAYILNKPESLPANGGNADTVGTKGIAQILAVKGWFDGDMDNLKEQGSYIVSGATNMPIPGGWGTACVFAGGTGSVVQIFTAYVLSTSDFCKTYIRHFTGDLWSTWVNIADGGNADTVDGLHANDFSQVISFGDTQTDTKLAIGVSNKSTTYWCSHWTDYPTGLYDGQGTIIAINYKGTGTIGTDEIWTKQIFITPHITFSKTNYPIYQRSISNTDITDWVNIADGGNAATVNGYTVNANVPAGFSSIGQNTENVEYTYKETTYTGSDTSEIFNDYENNMAAGGYSHAEGYNTKALKGEAHSEGYLSVALGFASHAEGDSTLASASYSHAEGTSTTASGTATHAEGYHTTATKDYSHSEGNYTTASGTNSHAEGYHTTASGADSHAEGNYTTASGEDSHAEGVKTQSLGTAAHVEGGKISSDDDWTVTLNDGTTLTISGSQANGDFSHAEGTQTLAYQRSSHAEGDHTIAYGIGSHAEGYSTTASGATSHAEGSGSITSGDFSHAEGVVTTASGYASHAEGYHTTAAKDYSHAGGRYNKDMSSGDIFVIGNGSSSSKSNCFRVTDSGYVYGLSSFNSSGADYAEFIKPWYDNNINNEDRVGYFVTIKNGLLYKANEGDYIVGITSGNPSVVGNADEDYYWRYERDEFNRFVYEDVEEEIPKTDDNGNIVMVKTGKIIKNGRLKLADNYDASNQNNYVERKNRPEWAYVGMVGVLPVRDDGTCNAGDFCKCGLGGVATKAEARGFDTFFVIERINENVISVEIR